MKKFTKNYSKKVITHYDQIAMNYFQSDAIRILTKKLDKFIDLLPGKKILDIACGPGQDTDYFTKKGFDCLGVDLSKEMIKIAKENFEGKFRNIDFFDLKLKKSSFDGLWCSSVFTFMLKKDLPEMLSNFKKLLKINGIMGIIITCKRRLKKKRPYVYTLYKRGEMESYLDKAGYRPLISQTFNYGGRKRFFIMCKNIKC